MDPSIPVAIVTLGGILKAPAEDFLKRIAGPAGDELGAWFRDKIRDYRARNAARTAARAQAMLAAADTTVREVPLRTLLPILDGASIEDDADLAEMWAALLANSANAAATGIPPIIPSILQQLTPFDAQVLVRVAEVSRAGLVLDPLPPGKVRELERWGVRKSEINLAQSYPDQLDASIDTLTALGLVEHEPVMRFSDGNIFATDTDELRITALGRQFLAACSAPVGSESQAS